MHIIVVGLNFKTAPIEIREQLAFSNTALPSAMQALNKKNSIHENVIVSTCNRTEVYAVVDQLHIGNYDIKEFLSEWFQINEEEFSNHLFFYEDEEAVRHLFKVATGLNSMIIGETQILGQVRNSFLIAQENDTTGTIFNHLMKQAITLAKRAHSETDIGANAVSVSYAAVELAKKIFGQLNGKRILVIGAGKMGELAIKNLYGSGAEQVTVINRTLDKAQLLAEKFQGKAIPMEQLQSALKDADIVISSTGSRGYIVKKQMLVDAKKIRKGRPLFLLDIAVPRDLDPSIADLDDVFLYDIDDLEGLVEENIEERKQAANEILGMIQDELVAFTQWLNTLDVVPVITSLREKALQVQAQTMKSIERKMPNLTEREKKVLNKHTKSIINQLLKDPILQVKEMASDPQGAEKIAIVKQIFNLDHLEDEEINRQNQEAKQDKLKQSAPLFQV